MKTCVRCKVSQALTEFYVYRSNRDGKTAACRTCIGLAKAKNAKKYNRVQRRQYWLNREAILNYQREWRKQQKEKQKDGNVQVHEAPDV